MNKLMTVGFAAVMAAGIAGAQGEMSVTGLPPAGNTPEPEVTAEAALLSSYVWRGQVYNNDAVLQPQITVSHMGFSLNVWGNYNLAGKDCGGVSSDFSEIDFSLAYNVPFNLSDMEIVVGATHYTFPNTGVESTSEVFVNGAITTFEDLVVPVIPSVTLFGDVDEARGTYVLIDVCAPYEVSEYLKVSGGVSMGYGNTSYNDFYFPNGPASSQEAGFNDYNFYGTVDYALTDSVTASFNLTYTMLEGGAIEDAARGIYDAKEKIWGGVNVAYDF
ncbi:MAG: MipA/OmpV family protein [Pontiellaceae bacterium]|nr:MipA/OmpV family protein [Pontiellaceae bacterium]MBN2785081.1 MipA/OmpV family protein [Pontiellaceae bacterium]